MAELASLLSDISVCFSRSTNLRTLLPRLGDALARHLPVIEIGAVMLDRDATIARVAAYAPESRRTWTGERSARFLQREAVEGPKWCEEQDPARVASMPVLAQLKLPVGDAGLLSISFSTEMTVDESNTDIMVDVLMGHCRRLGQLDATARLTRTANRNKGYLKIGEQGRGESKTEISVTRKDENNTDIPVQTIESALVACISAALQATAGRIYGESGAARLLGAKPSTLQSKMRKLGIERRQFVARDPKSPS